MNLILGISSISYNLYGLSFELRYIRFLKISLFGCKRKLVSVIKMVLI